MTEVVYATEKRRKKILNSLNNKWKRTKQISKESNISLNSTNTKLNNLRNEDKVQVRANKGNYEWRLK